MPGSSEAQVGETRQVRPENPGCVVGPSLLRIREMALWQFPLGRHSLPTRYKYLHPRSFRGPGCACPPSSVRQEIPAARKAAADTTYAKLGEFGGPH